MDNKVKAAVMVQPGKIEIQEFPFPALEAGALLLKVAMCGICGTDKHTWRGETKQYAGTEAESDTPFPIIPGHEVIGVVAELNNQNRPRLDYNGERLHVGDRVALCPDVICGECYDCRHTFAFPWCEKLRGYGNAFSATEPPHISAARRDIENRRESTSELGPVPSCVNIRIPDDVRRKG